MSSADERAKETFWPHAPPFKRAAYHAVISYLKSQSNRHIVTIYSSLFTKDREHEANLAVITPGWHVMCVLQSGLDVPSLYLMKLDVMLSTGPSYYFSTLIYQTVKNVLTVQENYQKWSTSGSTCCLPNVRTI